MGKTRLKIEYLTPEELQPYANNAKLHPDAQVEQIANSIREFDFSDPIGIWGKNEVVEGHGRLMAAMRLGLREVPVIRLDHLSDEQRRAYALAHNQTTMTSGWDAEKILKEYATINIPLDQFGFDMSSFKSPSAESTHDSDSQDDPWDDIERLDKHYGVPYQGNKSRIADIIISILPPGNRFVDLFGGGGAMTHCAMLSGKWHSFLYNDLNEMIVGLFLDAVHGKYADEHRVITRDDFNALKDTDAYVKYIWSFGNNGQAYLWGKDIEEIKCTACHALMDETLADRRLA